MRIFITGENGLIAKELEKYIISKGRHRVVWGNKTLQDGSYNVLRSFKSLWSDENELNICSFDSLCDAFDAVEPDVVINTAGVVGTDICLRYPDNAVMSNVYGAYNVAKRCKELNIRLIHFSTTAIYDPDDYDGRLINNFTRKNPKTHYGITKWAGEVIAKNINPEIIIVRPTFAFGGNEDKHSAVAKLIKSAVINEPTHVLLDPEIKKDYTYIDNLITAIYTVIKKAEPCSEFNISYGSPMRFCDIIDTIERTIGLKCNYKLYPSEDYLKNHIVDNSDIVRLGWKPHITLEEGILKSFESIKVGE